MNAQIHLGIDLGAESGRLTAGAWDGRRLTLEEIHRFPNGGVEIAGTLRWDVLRLWAEIQHGLALAARRFGRAVVSLGVDTWGLDFVLLSRSGELLGLPFHYRDARTRGGIDRAAAILPRREIFAATGIQFMEINSLYQLLALRERSPEVLAAAETFLTIPDFFHWCLQGTLGCEFTNATTTQLVDARRRTWSRDLLERFGLPAQIFPEIIPPGTRLGGLRPEVAARTGLGTAEVIVPATHDTASAVAAVPMRGRAAFLSSGTWSLLGAELAAPVLTAAALQRNFTNEGGIEGTTRLLKNIMGLWLVQQCRRSFEAAGRPGDYAMVMAQAAAAPALRSLIEPDHPRFLNPADMPEAIREFCRETGQPVPDSDGAVVRCALESLALKYAVVLGWLEELTGERYAAIHVVGGGARNDLLNQWTAEACARPVLAGPAEATVLGNVLVQLRARGELGSLEEMRTVARTVEDLREFSPQPEFATQWAEARARFAALPAP